MIEALSEGGVFVPGMLMKTYRETGLSDTEAMLMLQLMTFRQAEGNDFPTPEQLAARMGVTPQVIGQLLQRLMKGGFLTIDERIEEASGIQYERYNWLGWLRLAAAILAQPVSGEAAAAAEGTDLLGRIRKPAEQDAQSPNLFSLFEREFGRPLSPMECETISSWLDQDRYPDELIRFALKEAVFAGKLHLRYIDRILIEWSRNRVTNPDEAREHTRRFRGGGQ
ncbi:DnaD domain protein [Paenibacillus sp. 1P07SE]|uniref:DnaD domain protein n=1 Tax=Paenibacillus sp. 1P07SE TaxID=3132209 RepID=UPI0039A57EEE